jgi:hypothetical protein
VGKLLAVAAVALPIIAVGGLAYRKAVGDPDCSWQEALGRTYCVLNNCPGGCAFVCSFDRVFCKCHAGLQVSPFASVAWLKDPAS